MQTLLQPLAITSDALASARASALAIGPQCSRFRYNITSIPNAITVNMYTQSPSMVLQLLRQTIQIARKTTYWLPKATACAGLWVAVGLLLAEIRVMFMSRKLLGSGKLRLVIPGLEQCWSFRWYT
ncbi:hypothetical protein BC936DRAFT_145282 [Jimgerdemannia flammicorona]|uniref:Uncharacterized protein n=1 Tax=Jimgerdemannia flammicorona TaxID=994334 RepID=A0A433DAE3_9FUNG|nr:hypothetical protein BC936DRAFT_145282 [Jimgerdemannia flammicorona]